MSDIFHFEAGTAPLLISIPHLGSLIPETQKPLMTPLGLRSGDTDWHLDCLYAFGKKLGASFLWARYSRYVVDLNRPPNDESLYPGQAKTGLCPTQTFDGQPLYLDGRDSIADDEREARRIQYWQPYHDQLRTEIDRLRAQHGKVLLWEGHSIASVIPRLFDGKLPDLNIGTAAGASAAPGIQEIIERQLATQTDYSWAVNGRFKGATSLATTEIPLATCMRCSWKCANPPTWRSTIPMPGPRMRQPAWARW
ncbi:N-formylglutamate amidohydrolase family protein [Bordetella holmesii 41130]|nr:N-formylglutamate amidohydrolase family protein [Bordetella holmesii ATCC 51541]AIT25246.1 N-formylglutamate amidohydrolase family protein [Bordetella holmesii 44057]EWM48867.1 N-formylglutamate amidohydrolase family protein [Bordetella holmesii 41130]